MLSNRSREAFCALRLNLHLTGQSSGPHCEKLLSRSVILFQLGFSLQEEGSACGLDLGGSMPGQSPDELRFFLSHFLPRRTSSKPIGLQTATKSFGDAPFANTIRSSATDTAASRRTTSIMTGLGSGAASATVAAKPSPSCRGFRSLTPTTACWLAVRRYSGAWWSTDPGKTPPPRSRIPIGYRIPPPSAVGRAAWTTPDRQLPFCAKPLPAWLIGWGAAIRPIPRLGRGLG